MPVCRRGPCLNSALRNRLQHRVPRRKSVIPGRKTRVALPPATRIQPEIEITGTFKHRKVELVKEGFDPSVIPEPIFFNCPVQKKYVPVDQHLYGKICSGEFRL